MLATPQTRAQPRTASTLPLLEQEAKGRSDADADFVREEPAFSRLSLEDPSGRAFDAFVASLARAKRGEGKARVVFWGDSHTAPDLITGQLRDGLQADFGDAGPGFVLPGMPWPHHYHTRVEYLRSKGFKGVRISRHVRGGPLGVAGVALTARRTGSVQLRTRGGGPQRGHFSELSLAYLKQPNGGRVRVELDGRVIGTVSTRGKRSELGSFQFHAKDARHTLALHALGDGPVTLLGLSLERDQPGVIVDTLGIPGARAKFQLLWDETLYAEQLKQRDPDLVVLAYGTNEASDDDLSLRDYEATLRQTLGRIKTLAPKASCLLLGPTDLPVRLEDGAFAQRPLSAQIVEVQRKVAEAQGCAFADVVEAMGGPLSMVQLVSHDPPLAKRDYVHLTRLGYEALGDALLRSLRAIYRPSLGAR